MTHEFDNTPTENKSISDKPTSDSIKEERFQELTSIDAQILELITLRGRLQRKESAWRRSKGLPRIDPALEKKLWSQWEQAGKDIGVGSKLLRQIFNQLNLLGDESAQIKRKKDTAYVLSPRHEPLKLITPAPRCLITTRMWTVLAALSGQELFLPGVIQNDPLVELIKAMNQAGAALSWSDEGVVSSGSEEPLDFEDKLIYVGDDPMNLYLCIALSLTGTGRVKFSGGASLKMLDIRALNEVLLPLGARIVPLNPHGKGLPARLECGGFVQSKLALPKEVPSGFIAGLVLMAWAFPQGLSLSFDSAQIATEAAQAADILRACGVQVVNDAVSCTVSTGIPVLPEDPRLQADPILSAYLLALPFFAGGQVTLSDIQPELLEISSIQHLIALGADISIDNKAMLSSTKLRPSSNIDFGASPELLPLGLVLALLTKKEIRLALTGQSSENIDLACQFLDRVAASYTLETDCFIIRPAMLGWQGEWTSPDPFYCLAAALLAFINPGIALENPGQLTSIWPQFWNIYNTLPSGTMRSAPVKERIHDTPKRKRIKT